MVSRSWSLSVAHVQIMTVRQLPPRLCRSSIVITESRYGAQHSSPPFAAACFFVADVVESALDEPRVLDALRVLGALRARLVGSAVSFAVLRAGRAGAAGFADAVLRCASLEFSAKQQMQRSSALRVWLIWIPSLNCCEP